MKNTKYFIGLDVHKEKTSYCVRDRPGNIVVENGDFLIFSGFEEGEGF
jgi:hypothetical protein